MKKEQLIAMLAWASNVLGKIFKFKDEVAFSEADQKALDKAANKEGFAEKLMLECNSFNENESVNGTINEFMQHQAADDGPDPDGEEIVDDPNAAVEDPSLAENVNGLIKKVGSLEESNKKLKGQVKTLSANPEEDTPEEIITGKTTVMKLVKHSKTHLFGSALEINSFEGRPWNKKASEIKSENDINKIKSVDWNTINIEKINTDFGAYSRKNLNKIVSFMRDGFSIPAHWKIIANVSDEVAFSLLMSGEITQGKKKAWLPKNKNKFVPQIGKVYDKQIDMTWTGYELKSLEKSWLNSIFNNVGSSPYKMSFVEYLVAELIKQARKEDKITLINGVYYPNDDMSIAGSFMNAMSGLLKLIDTKKKAGEYNAFTTLGAPSIAGAYDYINSMVARLPHDIRTNPALQLVLSHAYTKAYKDGLELAKGTNTDYKGKDAMNVDGYSNIKFVPLAQLEGSDFMFITTWDNISILIDKPGEEGLVTFEKSKRDINAFVDYKLGPYVTAFGAQMPDGNLVGFDNQVFFSNDVEVLTDVFAPVPANIATPDLTHHHSLIIGEHNTSATDITDFLNETPGQKVYLRGNNDTNPSTLKNGANLILGADIILITTVEVVLMARSDGKFVKLYEIDLAASSDEVTLAADATTADAADGTEFITQANTGATAITDITNKVEGETYKITGGSSTSATTIADGGNFTLSAAMTLNVGTWIELYYNGSSLIESQRG